MKSKLITILILSLIGSCVMYSVKSKHKKQETQRLELEKRLSVSELPEHIIKQASEQLQRDLEKNIQVREYGIVIIRKWTDGIFILPINALYQLKCSYASGINIEYAYAETSFFYYTDYIDNTDIHRKSIAGKKLTDIMCSQTATYLHNLSFNPKGN